MQGKQREPQPQWQPITQLSLIARHIDGMLESASEQYANLLQAQPKPYVLDDYTIGRVREVFTTQQNDLWLFDEQLRRWQTGQLSTAQREEVERLVGQMAKLRQVIVDILNLADELKEGTIEKQLAKSDEQLGLEFLLRHFPEQ
jgi:hypothetical protein